MHSYSVQLRIIGKELDPDEVTRRLGLRPNQVRIAGERRSANQVWRESLWSYDGDSASAEAATEWTSLEDGLRFVLEKIWPKKELIQEYARSHEVVWWCGHYQSGFDGGPTLSASVLKLLGDLGIPLFIDNYFREAE
ncbi:MAG: DUF4279 domain-containing protein [Betaproteobacteria bacterium]|nr:DUF4279 domain-containing protein [Betaproteobacteria bacterium]PWB67380.1 MAG: hypothetical protein C3F16_00145 [Betaproteobacteria bacterium]